MFRYCRQGGVNCAGQCREDSRTKLGCCGRVVGAEGQAGFLVVGRNVSREAVTSGAM